MSLEISRRDAKIEKKKERRTQVVSVKTIGKVSQESPGHQTKVKLSNEAVTKGGLVVDLDLKILNGLLI